MSDSASRLPETTFVLLHGGRHGGWCWQRVARRLRARGHEVYTPTLTGLGERQHLLSPDIGLDLHVQDLVEVFEREELQSAVLAAHSYGGMVASGAMEVIGDRVQSIVYVDAHMPREGESTFELIGEKRASVIEALSEEHGEGWFVPVGDPARYGVHDPDDAAWLARHMTPQPIRTYRDASGPTDRAWESPGMFVECSPSSLQPERRERMRRHCQEHAQFRHRFLPVAHDAMVVAPGALTGLLLEAASEPSRAA